MGVENDISEDGLSALRKTGRSPYVTGWPDDELAMWVSFHRDEVKSVLCSQPENHKASFCEPDVMDLGI
ncbi:MAG TPA: hypothetical protein VK463_08785 [Desulfomonilaceae bacterium]|nr:hypothetical protein [Desulfomonilaceae bacterium]